MTSKLPLSRGWKRRIRSSVLHILALSHYTFTALLAKAPRLGKLSCVVVRAASSGPRPI